MAINGNTILVYKDSTLIGGTKSNSISTTGDLDEVARPGQGQWKCYDPGRKGGTIQIGYLVLADSALGVASGSGIRDLLQVNERFTLSFKSRVSGGDAGVSGIYILQSVDIQSARGNLVIGTFKFVLDGALT